MPRALQQGMLGLAQRTLAPSLAALGPNRYLKERDFLIMLGAAFALHLVIIIIMGLMPREKVTDIPVRALTFKIGGADRIAAFGSPRPAASVSAPVATPASEPAAAPGSWRAAPTQTLRAPAPSAAKPKPKIVPVKPAKLIPIVPPAQRQMPQENRVDTFEALTPLPTVRDVPPPAPAPSPSMPSALPDTSVLMQPSTPAIASTPQRFVRESGAAPQALPPGAADGVRGGVGRETTSTSGSPEEARARYEQQISVWIQQHKIYPAEAGGREGRVVVRMRIDRGGYVRYYALEQPSGIPALDAAAIDMIRRANPVPAVPSDYPAGNLIEFLIPITFRAPQ